MSGQGVERAPAGGARELAEFRLVGTTPRSWAGGVARELQALLSDHAHLEFKAAASALSLLRRWGGEPRRAQQLAALVREELEHGQRVLGELAARGLELLPDRPNPYMAGLLAAAGRPRRRDDARLSTLLVAALIELRSHERFVALASCPELADLHAFYRGLSEAEERHAALFLGWAHELATPVDVRRCWADLAGKEGDLCRTLPRTARLHGGHGAP